MKVLDNYLKISKGKWAVNLSARRCETDWRNSIISICIFGGVAGSKMWGGECGERAYNCARYGSSASKSTTVIVKGRVPSKPFRFWMPNGSIKFASFSVFCKSGMLNCKRDWSHIAFPRKKNSSDLRQSKEQPLAKMRWTCPPHGDALAYILVTVCLCTLWFFSVFLPVFLLLSR